MKRAALTLLILIIAVQCACAMNIGTYKAETEYGLFDGFKFNFFNKREGQKTIELKSETPEEKARLEREKQNPVENDEYQLFRFIQEGTVPF